MAFNIFSLVSGLISGMIIHSPGHGTDANMAFFCDIFDCHACHKTTSSLLLQSAEQLIEMTHLIEHLIFHLPRHQTPLPVVAKSGRKIDSCLCSQTQIILQRNYCKVSHGTECRRMNSHGRSSSVYPHCSCNLLPVRCLPHTYRPATTNRIIIVSSGVNHTVMRIIMWQIVTFLS